jgi:hypothetical protein
MDLTPESDLAGGVIERYTPTRPALSSPPRGEEGDARGRIATRHAMLGGGGGRGGGKQRALGHLNTVGGQFG